MLLRNLKYLSYLLFMPELPEVETIVRELKATAIGKKFWDADILLPSVCQPSPQEFKSKLKGLRIMDVTRRGKYIIFILDHAMRLVIHLRMSGRLMWKKSKDREKFIRVVFHFSDATSLYFSDIRKFGQVWLFPQNEYEKKTGIARLGIEPFGEEFTPKRLAQLFKNRPTILKNTLLRQDLIAGIGNIYADEICFVLGLHPTTRLTKISSGFSRRLYNAVRECLEQGIANCGVSLSDFAGTRGTLGKHQHYLKVYGRKNDPCYTCGTSIQKTVVAGRGTFFCPNCQKIS